MAADGALLAAASVLSCSSPHLLPRALTVSTRRTVQGDMAIVRQVFSSWSRNHHDDRLWPWTVDDRHGHVAGLRSLPVYRVMSDEKFKEVIWDTVAHTHYREGFLADKWDVSGAPPGGWRGARRRRRRVQRAAVHARSSCATACARRRFRTRRARRPCGTRST